MRKKIIDNETVYVGTGNVFADLGLPNPEEHLLKAKLMHAINTDIAKRNITQEEAANLLGLKQPELSRIANGHSAGFSVERLIDILRNLGHDVEIVVSQGHHSIGELRFWNGPPL